MESKRPTERISTGGILAAIAAILQISPVFLPVAGLLLSPVSSLPIAIAAVKMGWYSVITYLCAAIVIFLFSPQEAVIFLFTTGLFGMVLGLTADKKMSYAFLISSITLFFGISILVYGIGIPAFGSLLAGQTILMTLGIYLLFSAAYTLIWFFIIRYGKILTERL